MFKSLMCYSLLVGAAVLVGCKKDEAPETPVTVAPPPATQPTMPDVMPPPATAPAVVVPAVTVPEATTPVPATGPAVTVPESTTPVPAAPVADAASQSLLAEVEQDIKDKKWDDADAALKKLEAMKDQLPPDWLSRLKDLRTAVSAGKVAGGLKIPGLGQ